MTDRKLNHADLDRLLAGLDEVPEPSSDLMGRVLGDAYAEQPMPQAPVEALDAEEGLWAQIRTVFGGWMGLGGLVTAASVGFVIGFSPPAGLDQSVGTVLGLDLTTNATEASVSGFGWDFEEG